jgi:E3 ubiquitin-protein ligase HUWE1
LRSFDQADRAKFLQFVTGTSKVPLQGFGALEGMNGVQKFQIHRDDRSTDRLPSAHTWYVTCFFLKLLWSLTFLFFAASIN